MNINFENNLQTETMTVTVSLKQRKKVSDSLVTINTGDITALVKEKYTPPDNYELGECKDKVNVANNDYANKCNASWEFFLLLKKIKKTHKPVPRKNQTKKKNKSAGIK